MKGKALELKLRTRALPLSSKDRQALRDAGRYDWILFASKHGVAFFRKALKKERVKLSRDAAIAAVGPATAGALARAGLRARFVPKTHTALALAEELSREYSLEGGRILFPRSWRAPADAVRELRKAGAAVRVVPLYTSEAIPLGKRERRALALKEYDRISFTSPSGIADFLRALSPAERHIARSLAAECIGPTTAAAATAAGFKKVLIRGVLE